MFGRTGDVSEILYVYQNTNQGSPLSKLLVDQIVRKAPYEAHAGALTRKDWKLPDNLLVDIVLAQKRVLSQTKNIAEASIKPERYFISGVDD